MRSWFPDPLASRIPTRQSGTSSTRIHMAFDGITTRISNSQTRRAGVSAYFAPGDQQGMLLNGRSIKVYRRAGGTGPWVLVSSWVIPESIAAATPSLVTGLQVGIRNGHRDLGLDGVYGAGADYIAFRANATKPPAVS